MNKVVPALLISVAIVSACSKTEQPAESKQTPQKTVAVVPTLPRLDNVASFAGKPPQEMLDDQAVGAAIRKIVPQERIDCLKEIFNYMPDLTKKDAGVFGELTGSHADNWKYAYVDVQTSGKATIVMNCAAPQDPTSFEVYSNTLEPITSPLSSHLTTWLKDYGQDNDPVLLSNGKEKRTGTISSVSTVQEAKAVPLAQQKEVKDVKETDKSIAKYKCEDPSISFAGVRISGTPPTLSEKDACDAVIEAKRVFKKTATDGVATFCEIADKAAKDWGGYDKAIERVGSFEPTPETRPILSLLKKCSPASRASFTKEMEDSMNVEPYSVGNFIIPGTFSDKKCTGVIIKMKSEKSHGYYLRGAGSCSGFDSQQSPERKDKDAPHGDDIQKMKYDGAIPTTYFFQGKTKPFLSGAEIPAETAKPVAQQQPQQRYSQPAQNKGYEYANRAASIIERGSHPACRQWGSQLRAIANEPLPDYIKMQKVDHITGGQLGALCSR